MDKQPLELGIYNKLYELVTELGYDVHLSLPGLEAPYPFVVMGEIQEMMMPNKTANKRRFIFSYHIWGSSSQRTEVSEALNKLLFFIYEFRINKYVVLLQKNTASKRILADNSTNDRLWHGILELEFKVI